MLKIRKGDASQRAREGPEAAKARPHLSRDTMTSPSTSMPCPLQQHEPCLFSTTEAIGEHGILPWIETPFPGLQRRANCMAITHRSKFGCPGYRLQRIEGRSQRLCLLGAIGKRGRRDGWYLCAEHSAEQVAGALECRHFDAGLRDEAVKEQETGVLSGCSSSWTDIWTKQGDSKKGRLSRSSATTTCRSRARFY